MTSRVNPGSCPSRAVCPNGKVPKHGFYDYFRRSGEAVSKGAKSLQCQFVLRYQDFREQFILAAEVVIERAFGELRAFRNIIHGNATIPMSPEELIGRIQDAGSRLLR